ncbi:MAG: leucine-rich repeat protein [Lachnospiraceae bacterium]|nr:leucine-rich repeat protein [Lachnospiraceae bacterium]
MSKKTPIKKTKRRLKRTVRRSLAAVLMITAIGVAAIPVPENAAAGDADDTVDTVTAGYTETVSNTIQYELPESEAVYSLDVYEGGLYWQYKIDKTAKKVLQYNSSYPATSLTLNDTVPLNFFYVKSSDYETFINKEYTMKVSDYYDTDSKTKDFFKTYFSDDTDYKEFMRKVSEYSGDESDAHGNDSITKHGYDLSDKDSRIYYCNSELLLEDHILMPITNQISDSAVITQIDKVYNPDASGNSISGATLVYIPYFIGENKPAGFSATHDAKGYYLYQNTSSESIAATQKIAQIGDYAFARAGVLQSINLPDWLQVIGTGAFLNCYNLNSVNIPFLEEISDGAFKNCVKLKTVNWWMTGDDGKKSSGLSKIGKEAFYGSGVQESEEGSGVLTFPVGITEIGDAAFLGCGATNVEFDSAKTIGVNINQYAFYDSTSLANVKFNDKKINSFGDYCFAVGVSKNLMTEFAFPNSSFTTGKGILVNRTALTKITIPENVGNLKEGILDGCVNLSEAKFLGVDTTYDPHLFDDVTNEGFYVTGYATMNVADKTDNVSNASNPRRSTWEADKTAAGQNIPYKFTLNGKDYFEVCSGNNYLESIEVQNGKGTLTSCDLKDGYTVENGELVIPDKVGNTQITKIASGCFAGKDKITGTVSSLTIGNYITDIEASAFNSWPVLEDVYIGKSIQNIGQEAFANCTSLTDITFATPDSYDTLQPIGTDAFATNSGKLTIHGDLVDDYAPFKYAVKLNNYVNSKGLTGSADKYRILYQSRWDSPSSKHMSVIYGEYDDGNGYVTLVDYPLWKDFYAEDGSVDLSEDLQKHNSDMEKQYYNSCGNYSYPTEEDAYLEKKVRFACEYYKNGESAYNDAELYGPWINPAFCSNYDKWLEDKWLDKYSLTLTDAGDSIILDWLFTPMTVEAAGNPTAYFVKYPYNFFENYKAKGGDRNQITVEYLDGWTLDEEAMIKAAEEIVIPTGVDSIDIKGYFDATKPSDTHIASNSDNYIRYFGENSENSRKKIFVYDVDTDSAGLFRSSGIDDLYASEHSTLEEGDHKKGNDRIKKVDMSQSTVKYIPDYAFDDCQVLEEVSIPASCTTVGKLPFRGCTELVTLTSDSENVPAKNGIIYQKKEDASYELVECVLTKGRNGEGGTISPANDNPYISQVSSIGESAFEDCAYITYVDLSEIDNGASSNKLKAIPDRCFKNCDNLQKVFFPSSTNDFGSEAFANIRDDYYFGIPSTVPRLEVTIKGKEVNISKDAFDPKRIVRGSDKLSTIDMVTVWTYPDTAAERYVLEQQKEGYDIRLGNEGLDHKDHEYLSEAIRVNFWDYNGNALCNTLYLADNIDRINEEDVPTEVVTTVSTSNHRPGYKFTGWLGAGGQKLGEKITTDEITYIAQYESDGTLVNGKCEVYFVDGIDGRTLGVKGQGATEVTQDDGTKKLVYYIEPGKSFSELKAENVEAPDPINHENEGYKFLQWNANGKTWATTDKITSNITIISLYEKTNTSGSSTTTSNGTTTLSNGTTTTSGKTTSTSSSSSNTSSSTSSSSSNTSSSSNSSNTSGSSSTTGTYTVTVENGDGSGTYAAGSTVIISAHTPAEGMVFQKWTTESNGVTLASVSLPATTFVMPANNVTVKANYVAGNGATAATTGTGNGGSTTGNNGNTVVDITKPGISNKDLATANVNGSTDNFVIKISETDEATRAVAAALTNKYGSLDNILYYAMDITLYDSTGTTKITDTSGLSIDITIPIPDALVAYGGNNMAGAVINGDQLEELNESFTTINGVPCVRFTATHFSPYTIYVDTGNLTEGMLDVTPKTGDPIHPKWFLSIGLACLSIILFLKKDKKVKVKTA